MAEQGNVQGNPNTVSEQEAQDKVLGSENFFDQLEGSVNGMVNDGQAQTEAEVTPSEVAPDRQPTQSQSGSRA